MKEEKDWLDKFIIWQDKVEKDPVSLFFIKVIQMALFMMLIWKWS